MSGKQYVIGVFDGEFAKTAWKAYLSNRTSFGTDQLPKAQRIESVHRILLRAPDQFAKTALMAACTNETVATFAKDSVSALLLGPSANNVRAILYIHTRTHLLGAGHATHLLRKAQRMTALPTEPKTLSTTAAACNGWYASLLFLRSGFTCDMALFKTDITMPGEVTTGGSTALSFRWPPSNGENQVELVKQAMQSQRARRTKRSQDFANELEKVYKFISQKTKEQFTRELEEATAFTDNLTLPTPSQVSTRKRKKEPDPYVPPVRRSSHSQTSAQSSSHTNPANPTNVVTPRPHVPTSLLAEYSRLCRSSKSGLRSSRDVEATVEQLINAYSDEDGEDEE